MSALFSRSRLRHLFPLLPACYRHSWQATSPPDFSRYQDAPYLHLGSRFAPLIPPYSLLNSNPFPDIVISASQEQLHSDVIDKARTILNNAVMQEIEREDPLSADAYANVIRSHIISSFQHLKVSLFTLETLMTLYNEQAQKKASG